MRLEDLRLAIARAALVLAVVSLGAGAFAGCGGRAPAARPPAAPAEPPLPEVARAYPAARWIPARPTYAFAARTVADAQRALGDVVTSIGAVIGVDPAPLSGVLRTLIGFDPLSPDDLAALGIDPGGGVALFSEATSPTIVVRLADPARTRAYFDRLRAEGLEVKAVVADGVEVFTAAAMPAARLSWAIDRGWLWLHAEPPGTSDGGPAWLSASRRPGAPQWTGDWQWTLGGRPGEPPAIAGFLDLRALIAGMWTRGAEAVACKQALAPLGRAGVTVELGDRLGARLALDLGAAAAGLQRAVLPAPGGWSAAAAGAPLAAQWNLDLAAVRAYLAPCLAFLPVDLAPLDTYGVRTARAILQHYDHGSPTKSRGVASFDLAHRTYAAQLLDEIPGRSLIQRKRTFGPYQGYSLSIPFGGPTIDYVLDDRRALAGLGAGVLAAAVGSAGAQGQGAPAPILAIDVTPSAMSREAWTGLFRQLGRRPDALLAWRELHLAIVVDGTRLVLDAWGRRR